MLMKTRRRELYANIEKFCSGRDGGHADLFQPGLLLLVLSTMWVIKNLECRVLHCLCILYALCYLYQRLFLTTWHLTLKERISYNGSAKLNMFLWCRSFQALQWIRPWRCFHVQIPKFNSSKVSCFQQWQNASNQPRVWCWARSLCVDCNLQWEQYIGNIGRGHYMQGIGTIVGILDRQNKRMGWRHELIWHIHGRSQKWEQLLMIVHMVRAREGIAAVV
jgi:hypothetical protein